MISNANRQIEERKYVIIVETRDFPYKQKIWKKARFGLLNSIAFINHQEYQDGTYIDMPIVQEQYFYISVDSLERMMPKYKSQSKSFLPSILAFDIF